MLTGPQLVAASSHLVTFGGRTSVTLPAENEALSDPLSMTVSPQEELAVSIYLPTATGAATDHLTGQSPPQRRRL